MRPHRTEDPQGLCLLEVSVDAVERDNSPGEGHIRHGRCMFLSPLIGATLIYDRKLGHHCHSSVLIDLMQETFIVDDRKDEIKLNALCEACVMEGFEEDNEDESDDVPVPKLHADMDAINETVRSGATTLHNQRPAWLPSWVRLVVIIRSAQAPVFW